MATRPWTSSHHIPLSFARSRKSSTINYPLIQRNHIRPRSHLATLLMVTLSAIPSVHASPPLELKGIYPGMTEADLAAAMPAIACEAVPKALMQPGTPESFCVLTDATLGGAKAMLSVFIIGGKVDMVAFDAISGSEYDALSMLLHDKYGASSGVRPKLRWTRDGRVLQIDKKENGKVIVMLAAKPPAASASTDSDRASDL